MERMERVFPFLWIKGEDKEQLKREVQAVYDCGLRAFCIESRIHGGFCGERWFSDVEFLLQEAKRLGMQVWILDDKSYPTGIANGIIDKKYPHLRGWQIYTSYVDVAGEVRHAKIRVPKKDGVNGYLLGVYLVKRTQNGIVYSTAKDLTTSVKDGVLYLDIPTGAYRVYFLFKTQDCAERTGYIDMLNKQSAEKLIEAVYEPHYERFKEYFGNTLVGFFSDEPRLCNGKSADIKTPAVCAGLGVKGLSYPYSEEVEQETGLKDRKEWLLLWENSSKTADFRCRYMTAVTKKYSENFNRNLAKWCHDRGIAYCGHIIEDAGAHLRTGCSAGHYFRAMEGADMSGIDVVLHQIKPYEIDFPHYAPQSIGTADPVFFHFTLAKLASSSAVFDDEKKGNALCELFGAYGWGEGTTEMLYIANVMLTRGINFFIPHAFNAAYGHHDCPPHFYTEGKNPAYKGYQVLFPYLDEMASKFSGGKSRVEVAVLYHDEAEWSGKPFKPCDWVAKRLGESQIDYDFVYSEHIKNFTLTGGVLRYKGREYSQLIVPACSYLTQETLQILRGFKEKVVFVGASPNRDYKKISLQTLPTYLYQNGVKKKLLSDCKGLRVYEYEKQGEQTALFFNEDGKSITFRLNTSKTLYAYDPMARMGYIVKGGETVTMEKGRLWIVSERENGEYPVLATCKKQVDKASVWLKKNDESEFVPYKTVALPFDINAPEEQPKFCGEIRYQFEIDFDETDKLYIDYDGEFCQVETDGLTLTTIGGKAFIDTAKLSGKKTVNITLGNTVAHAVEDRYTNFGYYPAACLFSVKYGK